jgi:hypothetical protein
LQLLTKKSWKIRELAGPPSAPGGFAGGFFHLHLRPADMLKMLGHGLRAAANV